MKEKHIISWLEKRPLGSLSTSEWDIVKVHTAGCSSCMRACEAAQTSLLLLRNRAAVVANPSPFFQTKVLAAIREQGLAPKIWAVDRPLVTSMAVLVVMLGALWFLTSSLQPQTEALNLAAISDDSLQWVVVDRDQADEDITASQALTMIYDADLDAGGTDGKP